MSAAVYGDGEVIERTVMLHGVQTEEQWRDLEQALGLERYGLGRWKQWAAGEPKLLSDSKSPWAYDLDAAIAWARNRGLVYEVETNVRYVAAVDVVATLTLEAKQLRVELDAVEKRHTALVNRRHEIALDLVAAGLSYRKAGRVCGFSDGLVSQLVAKARKAGREFPNARPAPEWLRRSKRRTGQAGEQ